MTSDPNHKTQRTFAVRDSLWDSLTTLSRNLECSIDYLVNESIKAYLKDRGGGQAASAPSAFVGASSSSGIEGDLQRAIIVGKAFVFLPKSAFAAPESSWVAKLLWRGGAPGHFTFARVGPSPLPLPGAKLPPIELPSLSLAVVTSDKALYREGRDEARIFALDPLSPGAAAVIEVKRSAGDYARHPVVLDACGAASLDLRGLPVGDYKVQFVGAPPGSPACSFTVAEYRLAPLVASLVNRSVSGDPQELSFELLMEAFGEPVDGAVRLELMDRGSRVAEASAEAKGGVVKSSFPLSGEGPHSINVQLKADPSRTATVPIVGSRKEERSLTTFSSLGAEVKGSLLPSEGARAVRGIFLEEGAHVTTPFRLERVDAKRNVARITAASAAEGVRILVIDPSAPTPRRDAIDPKEAPHPGLEDGGYRRADTLFRDGLMKEALEAFQEALPKDKPAHPNYQYGIACCFARLGDKTRAMTALRAAIFDGFCDLAYLAADDDLKSLRGHAPFDALVRGGAREITRDSVASGEVLEVEVPTPIGLILIGAFVSDKPWEGWAATIAPEELSPRVEVPARARPGASVTVEVLAPGAAEGASAYVIVKDARLLGVDTPGSRLAGQSKAYVDEASEMLSVGSPTKTLDKALSPRTVVAAAPAGARPPIFAPEADRGLSPGGGPPPPRILSAAPVPSAPPAFGLPPAFGPPPMLPGAPPPPPAGGSSEGHRAQARGEAAAAFMTQNEPEVLFAGLLPMKSGRASINVNLGDDFADYLVEAFVLSGLDWSPAEARFRAEKDVFASLDVPVFVHPDDTVIGRVHAGAKSERMRVKVTRGGADVELFADGKPVPKGEEIKASRAELTFYCGPGDYEATVEDLTGSSPADRAAKRVDEPGKMRRVAKALRILEPGQAVSLDDDPSYLALTVLPGLDRPFKALVDATSDYNHACCEQTAAKIVAACAMYALSEDPSRRERAESIILAGLRREKLMWLRSRGFKMYPDFRDEPNAYYGAKAARYLWNLALLEDFASGALSPALARGIDDGLTMASDATAAYDIEWPPKKPASCEDAYAAIRFGKGTPPSSLIELARKTGERLVAREASYDGAPVGAVATRAEAAYAAAILLRAGGASERQLALSCANVVVSALGDEGRLYSTIDSVAAIALMAELSAAKVVGGGGEVELDGKRARVSEASGSSASPRKVRALDSVVSVLVTRVLEEDWESLRGDVPLRISLSKGMTAARSFSAGDALDLLVTLEAGYKPGDLIWICLPDALSRVVGGGQVKRFSVDLEGRTQLSVPLAATGVTKNKEGAEAPQKFSVCLRNMFEEERASSVGLLDVTVAPPAPPKPEAEGDGGGGSFFGRMKRALFGD